MKADNFFREGVTSPIQPVTLPGVADREVSVDMLREDLLHPFVSGNKWRKLKYNFLQAEAEGFSTVLTYGGAFSNHLAATAAGARLCNLRSIGIVRGEELHPGANATLSFALEQGMELHFISRSRYKEKSQPGFAATLAAELPLSTGSFYEIPEGGTNALAVKGAAEITGPHTASYDYLALAAGTGGTAAGVITGSNPEQQVLVFSALKGDYLRNEITSLLQQNGSLKENWQLNTAFHFGGYARWNTDLVNFINSFKKANKIALDPVYNGKVVYGLSQMIIKNYFCKGTRILVIHTGGLQGIQGFNQTHRNLLT